MNHHSLFCSFPFQQMYQPIFSPTANPHCFYMMPPIYSIMPPTISLQNNLQQKHSDCHKLEQYSDFQQSQTSSSFKKSQSQNDDFYSSQKERKKHRIQRVRDEKGRYYGVRKLLIQKKYKQNPKRNVITNIGNKLLSFIGNRSKSQLILIKTKLDLSEEEIYYFYQFMFQLRKNTDYYLNISKMKQIWHKLTPDKDEITAKNRSIFRLLSFYYLNNIIRLSVLNSTKIKRSSKIYHIKAIRSMLKELVPNHKI